MTVRITRPALSSAAPDAGSRTAVQLRPYWQWTCKRDGKTITINLTRDQAARYQPWLARPRDPRHPGRLEELSLNIASRDEDWPESPGYLRPSANVQKPCSCAINLQVLSRP